MRLLFSSVAPSLHFRRTQLPLLGACPTSWRVSYSRLPSHRLMAEATIHRQGQSRAKEEPLMSSFPLIEHREDGSRNSWTKLAVPDGCLRLNLTLFCGQAFRWRDCGLVDWDGVSYREYAGAIERSLFVLRQREEEPAIFPDVLFPNAVECMSDTVWYRRVEGASSKLSPAETDAIVRDYFHADVDMRPIFSTCAKSDERFRRVLPYFRGARTLRQPPLECLFAFICSSNNNVKRITGMAMHLAEAYGDFLGSYADMNFYAFPTVDVLAQDASEADLRAAGFGYRAKFVVKTSEQIVEKGGESFILSLRGKPRVEVAKELTAFHGIGRKVAGCIALMSLDCSDEIPCDTHIWQIAVRDYIPALKAKSLTDRVYSQVGDFFRETHAGGYAGWVNNVLFLAELSDFKNRLPSKKLAKTEKKVPVAKTALGKKNQLKKEQALQVKEEPVLARAVGEDKSFLKVGSEAISDISNEPSVGEDVECKPKLTSRRHTKRRRTEAGASGVSDVRRGLRQRKKSVSNNGKKAPG